MLEDPAFFKALACFLSGVVAHKIGSLVLGYGKVSLVAKDVIFQSLRLFVLVVEDVAYMRQLKYLQMQKSGSDEETIKLAKELDEQTISTWKAIVIHRFLTIYPPQLRGIVSFKSWEDAMVILTKEMSKHK